MSRNRIEIFHSLKKIWYSCKCSKARFYLFAVIAPMYHNPFDSDCMSVFKMAHLATSASTKKRQKKTLQSVQWRRCTSSLLSPPSSVALRRELWMLVYAKIISRLIITTLRHYGGKVDLNGASVASLFTEASGVAAWRRDGAPLHEHSVSSSANTKACVEVLWQDIHSKTQHMIKVVLYIPSYFQLMSDCHVFTIKTKSQQKLWMFQCSGFP